MNTNFSWQVDFIEWVLEELKKPPSSRSLPDLLVDFARLKLSDNITNPTDWAEENIEETLTLIQQKNGLSAIRDHEDDSPEAFSIKLDSELPPQERYIPEPRKQENLQLPPIELLSYKVDRLEKDIESHISSIHSLKEDIGFRSGSNYNIFESLRVNSQKIEGFLSTEESLKNDIEAARIELIQLRKDLGEKENCPHSIFNWVRANELKIEKINQINLEVEKVSRNLERHIGSGNFESEAQTFKTHFDHILLALPTGGSKVNGWLGLIFVVASAAVGIGLYWQNYKNDIGNKLNNLDAEIRQVKDELDQIQTPSPGTSGLQQSPSQNQGGTLSPNSGNSTNQTP